ncbi:MAG: hypothetical protein K6L73_07360 [Cellvibrionaceae bacterium]
MFSLFDKKPKLNNTANQDLSRMLFDNPHDPVCNEEFFHDKVMDFSLESLMIIDDYLESLRAELPEGDGLIKVGLRAGSYLGEVIRKQSTIKYNWLVYEEAIKVNPNIEEFGLSLGTYSILWAKPDNFVFPLAKVLKRLENGAEDSVYLFAKVAIAGLPE